MTTFRKLYGAGPLHLLAVAFCLAVGLSVVFSIGFPALWNQAVWWQSIAVWFVGAALLHDLVLFPLYSLVDRGLAVGLGRWVNAVRIPALGAGLSLLLFFPGIISQGSVSYESATGLTQQPFAVRWLLLVVALFVASGLFYAARAVVHRFRS
ncbi:hypothetical protein QMK17_15935 [Rhodococcus sp. G-MC3]|uniref:hypothetical protein n=1 Tax=Rhodococcus sp. G-MC3 TaxID=3046209 RepID=UPI0024BA753A|nr:hypothetical protein [Rhodococcus sp. G-MC3]MDJ0394814.1 hypothetical protein [Rhodococcus sp. G-MC3]